MSRHGYIMHDQARHKIQSIMRDPPATAGADRPLLSHPGWVPVTLLVVAVNLTALLPPPS